MGANRKLLATVLCATAALAVAIPAQAQVYLGAGVGVSQGKFKSSDFSLDDSEIHESDSESDTAYKLIVGYKFNKNFAVEGGYTNLGKFDYKYTGTGSLAGDTGKVKYDADAWHVSAVGILPFAERFSLFGKLGIAATKAKNHYDVNAPALGLVESGSESKSRTNLLVGVGLGYDVSKNINVRTEYEDYGRLGNSNDTGRVRASVWSLGMNYQF
jgi:OOP family OmpA-OmpF porin